MVTACPCRRFFAYTVDALLLFTVVFLLYLVFKPSYPSSDFGQTMKLLFSFFYFPLFESSRLQATPGEYLAKIQVTSLLGTRISLVQAFSRFLCGLFPYIIGLCILAPVLGVLGVLLCILCHFLGVALDSVFSVYPILSGLALCILLMALAVLGFYMQFMRLCSEGRQAILDYFSDTLMVPRNKIGEGENHEDCTSS
jgi:uncharacterized RDD family membrane protein YckC